MADNYYRMLDVPVTATAEEIKRAYRQLARELHPDRNPDNPEAEERFKEVTQAYETLSDPVRRKSYDSELSRTRLPRRGLGDLRDMQGDFPDLENIAQGIFSPQAKPKPLAINGADVDLPIELSFEEAIHGAVITFELGAEDLCQTCSGDGGRQPIRCLGCRGQGRRRLVSGEERVCNQCWGAGVRFEQPCSQCAGRGLERAVSHLKAQVPAGVSDGTRIRLQGRGEPGRFGGEDGDLYLVARVRDSSRFRRVGADLHLDIEVGVFDVLLGRPITVEGPWGAVELNLADGGGLERRVAGKGVPHIGQDGRGDLVCHLQVVYPEGAASGSARQLIEQLEAVLQSEKTPPASNLD